VREPGVRDDNDPENLPGGQTLYLEYLVPKKEIDSGTQFS